MALKERCNPVKDFNLEMLACEDEISALKYIGEKARSKNIFQGEKKRKRKSDHSFPLFAEKQLTLF